MTWINSNRDDWGKFTIVDVNNDSGSKPVIHIG